MLQISATGSGELRYRHTMPTNSRPTRPRCNQRHTLPRHARRRDDGTAMVEFAFVGVLFAMFLFGIINMGVLLSFKQNLTQSASEAARASVAVVDDPTTTGAGGAYDPQFDERYQVVDAALDDVLSDFDRSCGTPGTTAGVDAIASNGITCLRKIHDCAEADGRDFSAINPDPAADPACMTVRLEYDNTGDSRIMPAIPLIQSLEPDTMGSQTTVRLIPVEAAP